MSLKLNKQLQKINSDLSFVLKNFLSCIQWANSAHMRVPGGSFLDLLCHYGPLCKHVENANPSKCQHCLPICFAQDKLLCKIKGKQILELATWNYWGLILRGTEAETMWCCHKQFLHLVAPGHSHSFPHLCCPFSCIGKNCLLPCGELD